VLNISRFDLKVFPSSKGLFAGDIIIYDSDGNAMNNSNTFEKVNLISFEYSLNEISIESIANFILVVEKDTLFFNLINNPLYKESLKNSIIITVY
jgi:DNA topoisomerase VI subunit A